MTIERQFTDRFAGKFVGALDIARPVLTAGKSRM